MNRNLIRSITTIIGVILLLVIVSVLSGERGAASQPKQSQTENEELVQGFVSSQSVSSLAEGSAAASWTVEDMLAAQPYPLEINADEIAVSFELSKPDGPPGVVASSPPGIDFSATANSIETLTTSEAAAIGYDYPAPYARYQNFDSYQTYPYSTVGVMFFKQGGVAYRCSAASIGNYAIWTAGHCIHAGDGNPGTWSTDVIFVPAYENGNAPLGVWQASNDDLWVPTAWRNIKDLRYDMGGAILKLNGGKKISQVVGSLGFAYNKADSLHWTNIAYPSEAPFNGGTQQICSASFAYEDMSGPVPFPVAMGCDMTRGSSGGPWILDFSGSAGGSNLLNGNNSYRYGSHPEELFSPYFGSVARDFHTLLINGNP